MNYLQTADLNDYWIAPDNLQNLSVIFLHREMRRLVSLLLHRKHIRVQKKGVLLYDIVVLRNILTSNFNCNWEDVEVFLILLTDNGYFNPTCINEKEVSLSIPNKQMYQHLYTLGLANCTL